MVPAETRSSKLTLSGRRSWIRRAMSRTCGRCSRIRRSRSSLACSGASYRLRVPTRVLAVPLAASTPGEKADRGPTGRRARSRAWENEHCYEIAGGRVTADFCLAMRETNMMRRVLTASLLFRFLPWSADQRLNPGPSDRIDRTLSQHRKWHSREGPSVWFSHRKIARIRRDSGPAWWSLFRIRSSSAAA
jgi:hypothetical protein